MNKLYRLYTENKNKALITKEVSKEFEGFTVLEGAGYWKGIKESALVIEIITDESREGENKVDRLAHFIKILNNQENVLLTTQTLDIRLI